VIFGDRIKLLRPYDDGRLQPGDVVQAAAVESWDTDDETAARLPKGVCRSLCRPAADGRGPRAKLIDDTFDEETDTD